MRTRCIAVRQLCCLGGDLGWHEPHVGSDHRLANSLGICGIVLLPFDAGLPKLAARIRAVGYPQASCFAQVQKPSQVDIVRSYQFT